MITIRAGDIRELLVNNRTIHIAEGGSASLSVSQGNTPTYSNEIKPLATANHILSKLKTVGFSGLDIIVTPDDFDFLSNISNNAVFVPVLLTTVNGTTYSGELSIVGDLEYSTDEAKVSLEMKGRFFERL